jgi:hypothetical protein
MAVIRMQKELLTCTLVSMAISLRDDRYGMVISPNKLYVDKRKCIARDVLV